MELLNAEFAPHALDFACAIIEWEEWAIEHKVR